MITFLRPVELAGHTFYETCGTKEARYGVTEGQLARMHLAGKKLIACQRCGAKPGTQWLAMDDDSIWVCDLHG